MKKILSIILSLSAALTFASCKGNTTVSTDTIPTERPPIEEDNVIDTANQIQIAAVSISEAAGTVDGSGVYDIGATATLSAKAKDGYAFKMWTDGVTEADRVVVAKDVSSYTAVFEAVNETNPAFFTYEVTPFGASITGYNGSDSIIKIPQKIEGLAVVKLGDNCFDSSSVASVVLPDGLTEISDGAFWHCTKLYSVTLPDTVTTIGNKAFWQCTSLLSVNLPEGLTSLGDYAFNCCHALETISFPSTLTTLGRYVFFYCQSLKSIDVALSNIAFTTYEGVLFTKDMATIVCYPGAHGEEYTLPSHTYQVGNGAFATCSTLKTVNLHGAVTSVGNYAFYNNTALEALTVPSSVASIGNNAFADCTALTSLTVSSPAATVGETVLANNTALTTIKTPANSSFAIWCASNGFGDKIVNN